MKKKLLISIPLLAVSVTSIVFAIIMFEEGCYGYYGSRVTKYGADFYTDIAQETLFINRNLMYLFDLLATAFGFLFLLTGLLTAIKAVSVLLQPSPVEEKQNNNGPDNNEPENIDTYNAEPENGDANNGTAE